MNLDLHGIEPHIGLGDSIYEVPDGRRFDVVLTNPPFGTRGANQAPEREDFVISTSNKQLSFLQHVMTILGTGGRAAVVVPDNCVFADQAGDVFEILTEDCDLHTVLRLPNGTFTPYSPGTKTNVVFFTKGPATEQVWIYDARTNVERITKKDRPLRGGEMTDREVGQSASGVASVNGEVAEDWESAPVGTIFEEKPQRTGPEISELWDMALVLAVLCLCARKNTRRKKDLSPRVYSIR